MSKLKRIQSIITGLVLIILALLTLLMGEEGYLFILILLGITLVIAGLRKLVYYFSMARHMTGGRIILYLGILMFDFGILTLSLYQVPKIYLGLYLFVINAFSGGIDVMRAMEAKRFGGRGWRRKLTIGILTIFAALICIIYCREPIISSIIYSIGLIGSACTRFANAFRKDAIEYMEDI